METEQDYQDIIKALKTLKRVEADAAFKKRLYSRYVEPNASSVLFFPLFRMALAILAVLLILGSGVVVASENTGPGNVLYPVKKTVENIQKDLGLGGQESKQKISTSPTSTPTLTPSPATSLPQSSSSITRATSIPSVTPTPTKSLEQSSVSTSELSGQVNVLGTGISIGLGNNQSTRPTVAPSPQPNSSQILNLNVVLNKKPILRIGL